MEVRVNIELGDARKAGGVSLWAKQVEKYWKSACSQMCCTRPHVF